MGNNSKENEVLIDIENGGASHGGIAQTDPVSGSKWGAISLILCRILGFNANGDGEPRAIPSHVSGGSGDYPHETTKLLVNKDMGEESQGVVEKENEKERQKGGKPKRAPKPPLPPKGPSLDAADMRMLKELSRIAIKKRERMERAKAFKKMKAAKVLSASSSPSPASSSPSPLSSSSSSSSSGATISAMFITVLFFLVLIFQGVCSRTSSNLTLAGAPRPAPETDTD